MKLINGKLVLEPKNCANCEAGQVAGRTPCPKCKGTGRGPRGGKGACRTCNGYKLLPDWAHPVACPRCKGNYQGAEIETLCDPVPQDIYLALPVKIYRHQRQMTGNEGILGEGCVYSCVNYGRTKTDEQLIADAQSQSYVQATKVARDDGTLCEHLGIFLHEQGYSVRPVFTLAETMVQIALETPEGEYQRRAMQEGTLGALYR